MGAGLVAATLVVLAPSASATTTPTYEPDATALGTVSFYDTTGAVITHGSLDDRPLAPWLKASTNAPTGTKKALDVFYTPQQSTLPSQWTTGEVQSSSQIFPQPTAPGALATATQPVVNDDGGLSMQDHISSFTSRDTADPNIYQVRIAVTPSGAYWATDIQVDLTAHTWTQLYPVPSGPQSTPGVPTGVTATAGAGSATVSYVAPSSDGGSAITGYDVQYSSDNGTTWTSASAAFRTSTATTHAISGLTSGIAYVFRVAAINAIGTGTYSAPSNAVTPTAHATLLGISRNATVTAGSPVTIRGTLTDTTARKAIVRAPVRLFYRTSRTARYTAGPVTTSSTTGALALTVRPSTRTFYTWRYAGSATYRAATSAVEIVSVREAVAIHAKPARIMHGRALKIWGTVAPRLAGLRVTLQHKIGRVFRNAGSVRNHRQKLPNGRIALGYVFTVRLRAKGVYTYRAVAAGTPALLSGASSAIAVRAV